MEPTIKELIEPLIGLSKYKTVYTASLQTAIAEFIEHTSVKKQFAAINALANDLNTINGHISQLKSIDEALLADPRGAQLTHSISTLEDMHETTSVHGDKNERALWARPAPMSSLIPEGVSRVVNVIRDVRPDTSFLVSLATALGEIDQEQLAVCTREIARTRTRLAACVRLRLHKLTSLNETLLSWRRMRDVDADIDATITACMDSLYSNGKLCDGFDVPREARIRLTAQCDAAEALQRGIDVSLVASMTSVVRTAEAVLADIPPAGVSREAFLQHRILVKDLVAAGGTPSDALTALVYRAHVSYTAELIVPRNSVTAATAQSVTSKVSLDGAARAATIVDTHVWRCHPAMLLELADAAWLQYRLRSARAMPSVTGCLAGPQGLIVIGDLPLPSSLGDFSEEIPVTARLMAGLHLMAALHHVHQAGAVHGAITPETCKVDLIDGWHAILGPVAPHPVGPADDMLQLGRTLWAILHGPPSSAGPGDLVAMTDPALHPAARRVLGAMLHKDPKKRPSPRAAAAMLAPALMGKGLDGPIAVVNFRSVVVTPEDLWVVNPVVNEACVTCVGTTMTLKDGTITASGSNVTGSAGVGSGRVWVDPTPLSLPPVLSIVGVAGSWWAMTAVGVFAWGSNAFGVLGVDSPKAIIDRPMKVNIAGAVVTQISASPGLVFLRQPQGWLACGRNDFGQLGLGHTAPVSTPTYVPGSSAVERFVSGGRSTFAWTAGGLLGCGRNHGGQLGIGRFTENVPSFTPVVLPDDVKRRVDRVVTNWNTSFFLIGKTCMSCGSNSFGQLGLNIPAKSIAAPAALPFPVDDVIIETWNTLFIVDGELMACGGNEYMQVHPGAEERIYVPEPLRVPCPVKSITMCRFALFVEAVDGTWYARGCNETSRLGVGYTDDKITEWARVRVDSVKEVCETAKHRMFFVTEDGMYAEAKMSHICDSPTEEGHFNAPRKVVARFDKPLHSLMRLVVE